MTIMDQREPALLPQLAVAPSSELQRKPETSAADTFHLPSTSLFLGLMPVFSGLARRNDKGYHSTRHLQEAREIVTLLCSLTIVQEIHLGSRRGTTLKIRLLQDEASAQSWEETLADGGELKKRIHTNEKVFLRFNPHLFNAAVQGSQQTRYQYTLQLKKLARENARSQALTLTLGAHLPIKFRRNACRPFQLSAPRCW